MAMRIFQRHFVLVLNVLVITSCTARGNRLHRNNRVRSMIDFWATVFLFVKRFALCYRTVVCPVLSCLSVCPVCNIGLLWPNGLTDQDETWHAGRPRPWPYCVRWGPSSPPQKGGGAPPPKLSAHVYCSKTTWWIAMTLSMEVGLSPGDFQSINQSIYFNIQKFQK